MLRHAALNLVLQLSNRLRNVLRVSAAPEVSTSSIVFCVFCGEMAWSVEHGAWCDSANSDPACNSKELLIVVIDSNHVDWA